MKWEYEPKTNATMFALNSVAEHWVETEILIEKDALDEVEQRGPTWTPNPDDNDEISQFLSEKDAPRLMHDQIFIPMQRYSCIVMLFTTVEREIKRLVDNLDRERGPQKIKISDLKGISYLPRAKIYLEACYGIKIADCSYYEALIDMQKIRDCIIHCLGEVALSRDKADLVNLEKKRKGFFAHAAGEIYIDSVCVKQFLDEAWRFFVWVFGQLNWKITSHYQVNKLEEMFKKLK